MKWWVELPNDHRGTSMTILPVAARLSSAGTTDGVASQRAHQIPPPTAMSAPVVQEEASDARWSAAQMISCGSPKRHINMPACILSVSTQCFRDVGREHAGRYGVDADMRREFEGKAHRHHVERDLGQAA